MGSMVGALDCRLGAQCLRAQPYMIHSTARKTLPDHKCWRNAGVVQWVVQFRRVWKPTKLEPRFRNFELDSVS